MKIDLRAYRTFQALILGGLGLFLLAIIGDGRILLYINQRFVILILAAALIFLLLGQAILAARPRSVTLESADERRETTQIHELGHNHPETRNGWGLWLLAMPLLVGVLIPQRPLGSSAAALRGFSSGVSMPGGGGDALSIPSTQRNVLDWLRAFDASGDPSSLIGQKADLEGFIYHDPRLPAQHFIAARFSVTCCLADATAIGVEVDWPS